MNPEASHFGYLNKSDLRDTLEKNDVISPFQPKQFEGMHYKIRVGNKAWVAVIKDSPQSKGVDISSLNDLVIPPGREAIIRSEEIFNIPNNLIANIDPFETYALRGVLVIAPRILEPGSYQYLFFTLSNISDDDYIVQRGDDLAKVYFEYILGDLQIATTKSILEEPRQLPRLLDEEVETHPRLVRRVRRLQRDVERALRNDFLLLDYEINDISGTIITDFDKSFLTPAGYRLRLGDRGDIVSPKQNKFDTTNGWDPKYIEEDRPLIIRSGYTTMVRTKEKLSIPEDMNVDLIPLPNLTKRYVGFAATTLPPGYQGYVWCNLHNYGTSDSKLEYEEPIILAKFNRLGSKPRLQSEYRENTVYDYPVEKLPLSDRPELPVGNWDDLVVLTEKVSMLEKSVKGFEPTKLIVELIFLALVAGVLAGIILVVLTPQGQKLSFVTDIKSTGIFVGVLIFIVIYLANLFAILKKRN